MEILETDRLRIRAWGRDDLPALAQIYGDARVCTFLSGGVPEPPASVAGRLARNMAHQRDHGFGMWCAVLKDTGEAVGNCGLQYLDETPEIEIGWVLASPFWGRGLATEAARAILDYGFRQLDRERIVAVIDRGNDRSIAVARRLGLVEEGEAFHHGKDLLKFATHRADVPS